MDTENLVKMANNIGEFFSAEPDAEVGIAGVADHLRRFWESRMRIAIIQHYQAGGAGLSDIARSAVAKLAAERQALTQSGNG
jgi:formate dehydrogenase subunit delta